MPRAAKVAHVNAHPEVSLNLDSDGNGGAKFGLAEAMIPTARLPTARA
jgi:hypothetical protein